MNDEIFTEQQETAAQEVAKDELTDAEIAAKVGVGTTTFYRWKRQPHFMARVTEIARDWGEAMLREAITKRVRRLNALQDVWLRIKALIEARANDPTMIGVPGGRTGLLLKRHRGLGSGENFRVVEEFEADVGLLKEMRETMKQAAQEVGQWLEKFEHTKGPAEPGALTDDERLARLAAILAGQVPGGGAGALPGDKQADGAGPGPG